jgi:hypothetical protein
MWKEAEMMNYLIIKNITKACCLTTAWFGRFSARTSLQTASNARRYAI